MSSDESGLTAARATLLRAARIYGGALLAFSGGVDSALAAHFLHLALGGRFQAVTARSPLQPPEEVAEAEALARRFGWPHRVIDADPLSLPGLADNPRDRCFLCKDDLLRRLRDLADAEGLPVLADGSNADDVAAGTRPGLRALAGRHVRSPLAEAGLGKALVRALSRAEGLPGWDRPARSCLATRFPYGAKLRAEDLRRVADAERALRELGVEEPLRVRVHGDLARLELTPGELARAAGERRGPIAARLSALGFRFVTLDAAGYRSGVYD